MCGITASSLLNFDFSCRIEHPCDIEPEHEIRVVLQAQGTGKENGHQILIGGYMIRISAETIVGKSVSPLKRHEHVSALPAPMQPVDKGVQRMCSGIVCRIRMIGLWLQSNMECQTAV